jgi:hypothetical protein
MCWEVSLIKPSSTGRSFFSTGRFWLKGRSSRLTGRFFHFTGRFFGRETSYFDGETSSLYRAVLLPDLELQQNATHRMTDIVRERDDTAKDIPKTSMISSSVRPLESRGEERVGQWSRLLGSGAARRNVQWWLFALQHRANDEAVQSSEVFQMNLDAP